MSDTNLFSFMKPELKSVNGGQLPNTRLEQPAYLENGNPNLWLNNQNWEGSQRYETWTNLPLNMLVLDEFYHQAFTSNAPIIAPATAGTARVSYSRLRPFSISTQPLKEGELPPRLIAGSEKGFATYTWFGAFAQVSDVEMAQNPDEVLQKWAQDLVRSKNESWDTIVREVMYKGASRAYVNGCASVAEVAAKPVSLTFPAAKDNVWKYAGQRGGQLTIADLREVQKNMKRKLVKPHPRYGRMVVLAGLDGVDQLRHDPEWKSWNKYTDPSMFNNLKEVYGNTEFYVVEVLNAKTVKSGEKEVGVAFVIGADAYQEVKLAGHDMQVIYKPLGSAGTADPLNQVSTMGYKHASGVNIIRPEALVALHHAIEGTDNIVMNSTTITWTDDGVPTVSYTGKYDFTQLKDGANFFLDLSKIFDGTEISPAPFPTDQNTYSKAQSGKHDQAKDYFNPDIDGYDKAKGTTPPSQKTIQTNKDSVSLTK